MPSRLALGLAAALLASPAAAQIARSIEAQGVSREDTRLLLDAAASLYESGEPQVGDRADWANAETGASGTAEVTAYDGRCVTIMHEILPGNDAAPIEATGRRCRAEDGRWLIPAE
jgi:surface antigen